MRKTPKIILGSLGIAVLAAGAIACGSGTKGAVGHDGGKASAAAAGATSAPAAPKIATGKLGDTITLTSGTDKVEVTVSPIAKYAGDKYTKPKNAAQYSYVHITVNVVSGKYSANPYNFHFVGSDGARYDNEVFGSPDPQMDAAELIAGQKIAGNVGWDLADATLAGGQVEIDGLGFDGMSTAGIWKL